MNKHTLFTVASFLFCTQVSGDTPDGIYHKGWIDFNKNGKMDLYENPKAPLEERVQDLLSQMTLEEKASLCSGSDFWHTQPVERLGVPAVMMSDGLHFSACAMPSSPLAASPTTTQPRLCQSVASTMPFRIISSSSTTRTRIIPHPSF